MESTISRIVVVIVLLVLPVNVMTLVLSNMVLDNSREQVGREIRNTLDMNAEMLEDVLKRVSQRLVYVNSKEDAFVRLGAAGKDTAEESRLLVEALQRLDAVKLEFPKVDLLYFYYPDNEYTIISGHTGLSVPKCRQEIQAAAGREKVLGTFWSVQMLDGACVLFSTATWNHTSFGTMINLDRLLGRLNLSASTEGRVVFFTNSDENLFTSEAQSFFDDNKLSFGAVHDSGKFEVFTAELRDFDLKLVEVIQWDKQARQLPGVIYALQFFSVLTTLLVIPLLLLYIYRSVSRPLNRLICAMNKVREGQWEYRIDIGHQGREFEQLNGHFNEMMDEVKNLKISVYEKELERKNIKMRYLSQQIQPHFIMNAMNIIYSYKPEEYPLIQKMVLCISKYLRYIVRVNDKFVELYREVQHIKNYFEIQKARYPGMFFYIVEYDEKLKYALIPPLLIQNFAENAIKYSLKAGEKITILIVAQELPEENGRSRLCIRLSDTGQGISDKILEEIQRFQDTGEPQEGLGLGIQNTIERLKYLYSEEGSIRFWRDEEYSGTNVEIILPLHFAGEGEEYHESFID